MQKLINNLISAVDNLPSGNAGLSTVFDYHAKVLGPANEALRGNSELALSRTERQLVMEIVEAFKRSMEAHVKIVEGLAMMHGAEFRHCDNCDEQECEDRGDCPDPAKHAKLARGILNKLKQIDLLEEVEDICD